MTSARELWDKIKGGIETAEEDWELLKERRLELLAALKEDKEEEAIGKLKSVKNLVNEVHGVLETVKEDLIDFR